MPSWARTLMPQTTGWLREAFENQVPIIYFLGIAPGRYQAMLPAFISGWAAKGLTTRVHFGGAQCRATESTDGRRYKPDRHQAEFPPGVRRGIRDVWSHHFAIYAW